MDSTPEKPTNTEHCWPKRLMIALLFVLPLAAGFVWWERSRSELPVQKVERLELSGAAIPALQAKAEQNDKEAQFALASAYAVGNSVTQSFALAATWYRKAAEQNHAKAQTMMGELHEAGQGVRQDYAEAMKWYEKAAANGESGAQYNIAVLHAFGRGVPMNGVEAAKWYQRAAENSEPLAQFNLGQRFQLGKDVAQDNIEAYKWLHLAHGNGIRDAKKFLDALAKTMGAAEIAEAKRRAASLQRKK